MAASIFATILPGVCTGRLFVRMPAPAGRRTRVAGRTVERKTPVPRLGTRRK